MAEAIGYLEGCKMRRLCFKGSVFLFARGGMVHRYSHNQVKCSRAKLDVHAIFRGALSLPAAAVLKCFCLGKNIMSGQNLLFTSARDIRSYASDSGIVHDLSSDHQDNFTHPPLNIKAPVGSSL